MSKRKLNLEEIEAIVIESDSDEGDFESFDFDADSEYHLKDSPGNSSDEDDGDNIEGMIDASAEDDEDSRELLNDGGQENDYNTLEARSLWTEYVGRHKDFKFIGKNGFQSEISPQSTPLDVFLLTVDDEVINHIVVETNRFAEQSIVSKPKTKNGRINEWAETDSEEIKKFLGLMIWMGLVPLGRLEDYWSQNSIYNMTVPRTTMSRNRFQALLTMLHFDNNETTDTSNRLRKIQPLIDMLQKKFKVLYYPGEDCVIDEIVVPWRGRPVFRQYIPNKTHRYGIKLFKLCSVDGYTWGLKVYAGKSASGEREIGLKKNICMELSKLLLNEGRTLYINNFYTSYELAESLLENKTHVVGTIRASERNMPKDVFQAKLKKGEIISRENEDGIVVLKWNDTRDVQILTTKHAPTLVPVSHRQGSQRPRSTQTTNTNQPAYTIPTDQNYLQSLPSTSTNTRTSTSVQSSSLMPRRQFRLDLFKPEAVLAYNKGKAGIDKSDQMGSYATTLRKGVKWYRKLGIELLLGVAVVNAWILYGHMTKSKIQIRKFREQLVAQLLNLSEHPNRIEQTRIETHHLIDRMGNDGKKIRRKCSMCYTKISKTKNREDARKQAKQTYTYCDKCPAQPQMCRECFNSSH